MGSTGKFQENSSTKEAKRAIKSITLKGVLKNAALRKRNLGVSAFRFWGEESVGHSSFLVYFEKLGFGLWAYIITPATSTTIL